MFSNTTDSLFPFVYFLYQFVLNCCFFLKFLISVEHASFLFSVLLCVCTNTDKNVPSNVVGLCLERHYYSDEKRILLIAIYFLPPRPCLLLLTCASSWLSNYTQGESCKDLYFLRASLTVFIFLGFVFLFSFFICSFCLHVFFRVAS